MPRVVAGETDQAACVPPLPRAVLSRFDDSAAHYGPADADERVGAVNRVLSGLPSERR